MLGYNIMWEYRILVLDVDRIDDNKIESQLDKLGALGWELVSAAPRYPSNDYHVCYFKRKK